MRLLALLLLLSGCAHGNDQPIYSCENLADYGCPDTAPVNEED